MPSKPSDCTLGFKQSTEKAGSSTLRDACRHCGKTKRGHEVLEKEQELPSDMQADEFLVLAGYKNTTFYELGKVILTRYIEWKRGQYK